MFQNPDGVGQAFGTNKERTEDNVVSSVGYIRKRFIVYIRTMFGVYSHHKKNSSLN